MPDRARAVAERYSHDAAAYERLWAPVLKPLALPLLDAMPLREARRVIDIGAGPGFLLQEIAARAPEAYVVGADLTHGMIVRAPPRYGRCVADARAQAFRDGSFDAAATTFVFQHVPDPGHALTEARRVLRAGGTLGMLTWYEPIPDYLALDVLNELLDEHGAEPERALERTSAVEDPGSLAALLSDAGFVVERQWTAESSYEMSPESFLERVTSLGAAKRRIATLPDVAAFASVARRKLAGLPRAAFVEPLVMIYTLGRA